MSAPCPRGSKRIRSWLVPLLAALSLLGATSQCDIASTTHGLTDDSFFELGGFVPGDLGGSFRLVEMQTPPGSTTRVFRVEDVFWVARIRGRDVPITGSGAYTTREEFARAQRLVLDLRIGDAPAREFDSGLVPILREGDGLDVTIFGGTPEERIRVHSLSFASAD